MTLHDAQPAETATGENERELAPDIPLSTSLSGTSLAGPAFPAASGEPALLMSELPTTPLPASLAERPASADRASLTPANEPPAVPVVASAPLLAAGTSSATVQETGEQASEHQWAALQHREAPSEAFTASEVVLFDQPAADPLAQPLAPFVPAALPFTPPAHLPAALQSARGRRLDRLALFGLGAALLLLVLSAGGLLFDLTYYQPAQVQSAATATAHAAPTFTARASQTQIVYSEQTSTAQQQATVTAYQTLYKQALSVRPFINDSLKHQSNSAWDEGSLSDHSSCSFVHNSYEVKEPHAGYFMPCFAENSFFINFALQVNLTIVQGDEAGVFFRVDDNGDGYLFELSQTGSYDLYSYGSHEVMSGQTQLYKFGQANQLTIIARGTNYYFYLNQQFIDTTSDKTFGEGALALVGSDIDNPTVVDYTNFKLWLLP